jgi:hypothetical protein
MNLLLNRQLRFWGHLLFGAGAGVLFYSTMRHEGYWEEPFGLASFATSGALVFIGFILALSAIRSEAKAMQSEAELFLRINPAHPQTADGARGRGPSANGRP